MNGHTTERDAEQIHATVRACVVSQRAIDCHFTQNQFKRKCIKIEQK